MKNTYLFLLATLLYSLVASCQPAIVKEVLTTTTPSNKYENLTELFHKWRTFETPPLLDGAPDYTVETFQKRWPAFQQLQQDLLAIDTMGWSTAQRVDWHIVWAEMNGYDFNPVSYTHLTLPTIYTV